MCGTGSVLCYLLLKLGERIRIRRFDTITVFLNARNFCVSAVVVFFTVCCRRVLFEERKLVEDLGRNTVVYTSISTTNYSMQEKCHLLRATNGAANAKPLKPPSANSANDFTEAIPPVLRVTSLKKYV